MSARLATGLISDFESTEISSVYGHGWVVSTDKFMDGKSDATMKRLAGGASGSKGALEVMGEIRSGFAFPFAGCMFFPGDQPMRPVDASAAVELVFRVKGDGRTYQALLMSGATPGPPSRVEFAATSSWREVRLKLADFRGADLSKVMGIGFVAGTPPGRFRFLLDQVELR